MVAAADRGAEAERTYRLLTEHLGEVVCHVADDGRVVFVSPSVEHVLGAPPEHWVGRNVADLVPPEDVADYGARVDRLRSGDVVKERFHLRAADGSKHWVHVYAVPFFDDDGRQNGAAVSFRDIDDTEATALQLAEKARREKDEADDRYRKSIEYSPIGMSLVGADGRFEQVNPALCDFLGYDADTLLGMTWQEVTAPESLEADLANVHEILEGRSDSYRTVKKYVHADGHPIWGELTVRCVRDDRGRVEHLVSQVNDVTEEIQVREHNRVLAQDLQRQTERLTTELESAAAYMSSILPRGLSGRVEVWSRYLPSRLLGGDSFDYTWIDDDHLLVYLIDVSGHGIEPALLSVSLHNMLRSRSFPVDTLLRPDRLLAEMNRHFQMANQNDHYFTIWYGVYEASTRTLNYACAGAPPALAFHDAAGVTALSTGSIPVGMFTDAEFPCHSYAVPPGCRLLVYSDGAYELDLADGRQLSQRAFVELTRRLAQTADWSLDDLTAELRALTPSGLFEDDCSLIQLVID